MNSSPLVSVIIPVYNGEKYIEEAVQSVLNQTYSPIEIIVINDGSTDRTLGILEQFQGRIIFRSQTNKGAAESLNLGISLANGKYFARLDADDIARVDRIEKQVIQMEAHEEIGICGSSAVYIDESGAPIYKKRMPRSYLEILWKSLFTSPFISSSVMVRMKNIKGNRITHKSELQPSEDYGFWSEILKISEGINIDYQLINYRVHQNSASSTRKDLQEKNQVRIARENIKYQTGLDLSETDVSDLCALTSMDAGKYKFKKINFTESIIRFLGIWKVFREKFPDALDIKKLEPKIIAQAFGMMILYVPIREKWRVIKMLNFIKNKWIFTIPQLIIPYLVKYFSFQRVNKYR